MWIIEAYRMLKGPNGRYMGTVAAAEFGQHATRNDAVRALVELLEPSVAGCSIEHIKRVSKEFLNGSMKTYRVTHRV